MLKRNQFPVGLKGDISIGQRSKVPLAVRTHGSSLSRIEVPIYSEKSQRSHSTEPIFCVEQAGFSNVLLKAFAARLSSMIVDGTQKVLTYQHKEVQGIAKPKIATENNGKSGGSLSCPLLTFNPIGSLVRDAMIQFLEI